MRPAVRAATGRTRPPRRRRPAARRRPRGTRRRVVPTAGPGRRRPIRTRRDRGAPVPHRGAPAPHRRGRPDDRGQVGGAEALPFGLLVFVVGALLVAQVWAVVDAKFAVDAAARQATRTFVEGDAAGPADAAAPERAAVAAGLAALEAHGRDPARADVRLTALEPSAGQSGFTRCARVTFTATYEVPALTVPWIGGFGDGIAVTSTRSELVDPFRSGVPGTAEACG